MAAIKNKSGKQFSALALHRAFSSPPLATRLESTDANFDGIGHGGFLNFAKYIGTTPDRIEEEFYNTQIVQDGPIAFATFDYEFFSNDKLSNCGVEHWQMRKTDGQWKIFSVIWTQYEPEKR